MALASGTRLGPYVVLSPLGSGGMGEVYRARDTRLDRDVAVKVLPEDLSNDPKALARFQHEAKAVAALSHPNILALHDVGETGGVRYAVTELLEGETLRAAVTRGAMPVRRALEIAHQIAEALAAAHAKGIVHRDLKPENVFLTRSGPAKLLDFGLAVLRGGVATAGSDTRSPTAPVLTETGAIVGTVAYMSPEQARGEIVDFRTDHFSLGIVLYEMLTGRRPFKGVSAVDLLAAIVRDEAEPLERKAPHVPGPVRWVVERCLAKEPDGRYAASLDLAHDLASLRTRLSEAAVPVSAPSRPRRRAAAVALATAAALLLICLGFLAGRSRKGGTAPPPRFTQLTFSDRAVLRAAFTRDGGSVVYTLAGRTYGAPKRAASVHELTLGNPIPREVLGEGNLLLAVSPTDQLAVLSKARGYGIDPDLGIGTLGISPRGGALPRPVSEGILDAAWHPGGTSLAVIRVDEKGCQLEFPEGKVLHRFDGGKLAGLRFSPDGRRLAMFRRPIPEGDDGGSVFVVEVDTGRSKTLGSYWASTEGGLAWRPDGREIWFGASHVGTHWELLGVDLAGKERRLLGAPSGLRLLDVAPDGRALVAGADQNIETLAYELGAPETTRLTIRESSSVQDVSLDGRLVLVNDLESESAPNYALYLRPSDGSLPTPFGSGNHGWISADKRTVLVWRKEGEKDRFVLVPVGGGPERPLQLGELDLRWAVWSRTGALHAVAAKGKEPFRIYRVGPDRPPEPVSAPLPAATYELWMPEPDGRRALARFDGGTPVWIDLSDPGKPFEESRLALGTRSPLGFSADGEWVYVRRPESEPLFEVERISLRNGKAEPFRKFAFPGLAGGAGFWRVSDDGTRFVTTRQRFASRLFLVEGLR